ncbi:uncharacterized protein EDB91DRAFT_1118959 [Suillus paluster]|uniref:uncharacterized protein n=1 Tax=Suillus paluster TaxID=48578 RepID=UPI001B85D8DE|nr:uncharacterized protein EDB91DRAFT_1118959 [Suillus paluster]KAG1745834.1 hypothetical protein EDB91DRAFT_1118959 [Suillus paluster]
MLPLVFVKLSSVVHLKLGSIVWASRTGPGLLMLGWSDQPANSSSYSSEHLRNGPQVLSTKFSSIGLYRFPVYQLHTVKMNGKSSGVAAYPEISQNIYVSEVGFLDHLHARSV